jgi:FkbM family methyltransferase
LIPEDRRQKTETRNQKLEMGIKAFLKRNLDILRNLEPRIRVQVRKRKSWYGNKYGGFFIFPEGLNEDSIIYSFGIGEDVSFDLDVIDKHKCKVYAYDPTPRSIEWISNQALPDNFHFQPWGIHSKDGESVLYLPKNKSHVSGSLSLTEITDEKEKITVPVFRLKILMEKNQHDHISVLKMDIEGAEYDVIEDIISSGINIQQILVEFHHRLYKDGVSKTRNALKLLNDNGYKVFGVSDLNSEISLINEIRN